MLNISTNKQIAHDWIDAFNSRDLEKLLALYDDAAVHFSPKLKALEPDTEGWVAGKTAMRAWWSGAFKRLQTLQYNVQHLIVDDHTVVIEYMRKAHGEADMMVAEVFEIVDGKIVRSRVYHG